MRELDGGQGVAVPLDAGSAIRIVNTFGSQVVDTWALSRDDTSEYLSVEQSRRMLFSLFPKVGEPFVSNRRSEMLLLEEDSAPGHHDMLFACCDRWLYKVYGCAPGHRNCHDNYIEALFAAGFGAPFVPNPVNLWMNIPVSADGTIGIEPPVSRPGDQVVLRAKIDLVVVLSACPMDVTPINGPDKTPRSVGYEVLP